MAEDNHINQVTDYYHTHPINERQILEKLTLAGVDLARLSEDVLQNHDQDHFGGIEANDVLAGLAGIGAASHVLDVCSGMGGPARYLAHNYGCRVTGIDLTESRVASATKLTTMAGLSDQVSFHCGNALKNPFPDQTFDVAIGQEAFCHIPRKAQLIAECVRVLKIGGRIAFTDIIEREGMTEAARRRLQREMTFTELQTFGGYRQLLEDAGCSVLQTEDLGAPWTGILKKRLEMYRGLKEPTVARFGAAHFEKWDDAYSFFVGRYETGELGGGRFVASRGR